MVMVIQVVAWLVVGMVMDIQDEVLGNEAVSVVVVLAGEQSKPTWWMPRLQWSWSL